MATDIRLVKYKAHKRGCKYKLDAAGNPVEMRLTFDQWWEIWERSGKWEQYGCRKGQYCMCRYNDLGHYEPGNVFIDLQSNNSSAAHKDKTVSNETRAKISAIQKGKPKPYISEALKGRKKSPEHIARSVASKAANRLLKQAGGLKCLRSPF